MTTAPSARFDGDTWNLASGVGATATMVAAARAVATRAPGATGALFDDPYAEPLVRAVGVDFFARLASGELTSAQVDGDATFGMRRMIDGMAVRTRYFDDFFSDAAKAGNRQAVILASGLDSRAYRLPWPAGTTVFEIDQPQVIEFKTATMAELGAEPTAVVRAVSIDLRGDWPAALRASGFAPAQPTAWIAEGLLGYLPPEAQDRLLDQISALSAPGSRFGVEVLPGISDLDEDKLREQMQGVAERWREQGFELDMTDLVYFGDREDVPAYLAAHGWETTGVTARDLLARYGLPPIDDDFDFDFDKDKDKDKDQVTFADVTYLSATRQ